ncbi:MAG: asparagine synthetase B, partial [Clostridia bacterium]|nr:asparagine synthetase B [Clostridia bacterium]
DTKAVLRTAANKTLPDEWANRPKKGFPVPIRKWLAEERFYDKVKKSFTSDVAAEYFVPEKLNRLLEDHKNGKANNGRKIWTAFTFLTWHDRFIK